MRRQSTLTKIVKRYTKILKGYAKALQLYIKALQALPRETLILIGTALLTSVGVLVFFIARNTPSPIIITDVPPVVVSVSFTKLTEGTQSVIGRRVNYVLTSPTELNELWKVVDAPGKPPKINFKTHAVIAVFAGQEASASIAVAKIEDANTRMVSIAIAKPDGPCAQVPPAASPYEIVAVPATSLHLTHKDVSTTVSCPK